MVVEVITAIAIYVLFALALGALLRFNVRGAARSRSSETGDATDD
jgi:hypothetical protein